MRRPVRDLAGCVDESPRVSHLLPSPFVPLLSISFFLLFVSRVHIRVVWPAGSTSEQEKYEWSESSNVFMYRFRLSRMHLGRHTNAPRASLSSHSVSYRFTKVLSWVRLIYWSGDRFLFLRILFFFFFFSFRTLSRQDE